MRSIEQVVYSFDELNAQAKQKVLDTYRYDTVSQDLWYENVYDAFKERLKPYGFSSIEPNFTGFYNQGDGASFTAHIDMTKFLNSLIMRATNYKKARILYRMFLLAERGYIKAEIIRTNYRYAHADTCEVEITTHDYLLVGEVELLYTIIKRLYYRVVGVFYNALAESYKNATTDEAVAECVRCLGFEFFENGTVYN